MANKVLESKDLSHVNIAQLKQYEKKQHTDTAGADKAVEEFMASYTTWREIVGYMLHGGEDGGKLYGATLCTFSGNLYYSTQISADTAQILRDEIEAYEYAETYMYPYKDLL